jgi:L-ascorbate metabolism protein UlaG (beta-lactamase superfamily)
MPRSCHFRPTSDVEWPSENQEFVAAMTIHSDQQPRGGAVGAPRSTNDVASAAVSETGSLFFVGTATMLLELEPFTVLTDPNFLHRGESVGIGYGLLRSRRLTEPAISIDALPPLDLVVLSHHHEDHFDRRVTERLDRTVPILTTPDAAQALRKVGFRRATALRTWQLASFVRDNWALTVTALPGRHGPALMTPFLPSVMGSLLELRRLDRAESLRIYISGDTLVHDDLWEIPSRFPGIDLALLHLGGTRIMGLLLTMDGKQGVEAIRIVRPEIVVPIHYDDYDIFKSPLDDFRHEVVRAGLESRVRYVARGESVALPPPARKPAMEVSAPAHPGLRRYNAAR